MASSVLLQGSAQGVTQAKDLRRLLGPQEHQREQARPAHQDHDRSAAGPLRPPQYLTDVGGESLPWQLALPLARTPQRNSVARVAVVAHPIKQAEQK